MLEKDLRFPEWPNTYWWDKEFMLLFCGNSRFIALYSLSHTLEEIDS